ncbi:MAG TPA: hypothetical protein VMV53_09625 [Acidimicrobiales bacterium]|nr:hypothetical protein [Acidimicrobiales bacterium]
MLFHDLTTTLGWSAVVLGAIGTYAQFRRVTLYGVEGMSLATWVVFVYLGLFWGAYGVVTNSWEMILGSLATLPLQLAIVARLAPVVRWRVSAGSLGAFGALCVVPTLEWGWSGGIYGAGVVMALTRGPQLVELVRCEEALGVSVGWWGLSAAAGVMWMAYYTGVRLWAAFAATAMAAVASTLIALLATWRHQQSRDRRTVETVFSG